MDRASIRQYQMAQLKLLEYFDHVCRENNFAYFLVFGTLLGAVRHNGFIPWDADIDVAMYRRDYEGIRQYFKTSTPAELFYEHYSTEKNHISPHAELRIKGTHVVFTRQSLVGYAPANDGIYIDIFPIDNVADPERTEKEQVKRIKRLRRLVYYKTAIDHEREGSKLKRFGKTAVSAVLKPFSFRSINARIDRIMQKYNSEPTEYAAILTDPQVYRKQLFPLEVFGKGKEMEFEGSSFLVPENPEQFLTIRYGDYLKLPPENERWNYCENAIANVDYGDTSFLCDLSR